ncbi:MAG: glycosyltransferase family 8 protein [Pseudomonadota bacterium]
MKTNAADSWCYLTTIDDNYVPHLLAMLSSLARVESKIPFLVAHVDMSEENQRLITDHARSIDLPLTILHVTDIDLSVYQPCGNYPPVGWLKLHIDEFVPKQYDRILFIDPDTIVLKPLRPLFDIDMQGMPIAAAFDLQDQNVKLKDGLGIAPHDHYYNSGVILVDRAIFREQKIGELSATFAIENPDKILFIDQCAFNAACKGKMRELDATWNLIIASVERNPEETKVVHYAAMKPWVDAMTPGIELYAHFRNQTPLPFKRPPEPAMSVRIDEKLGLTQLYYLLLRKNKKYRREKSQRSNRRDFAEYVKRSLA